MIKLNCTGNNTFTSNCRPKIQKNKPSEQSPPLAMSLAVPSVENLKANFLTFKGMYSEQNYTGNYSIKDRYYNGAKPDTFILKQIRKFFPLKENRIIKVLDLGAGDGRNTIPLAKHGYDVTAVELSDSGRDRISLRTKELHIEDKVQTIKKDICQKKAFAKKQYNFAFMDHVTQHFNETELNAAMKNISCALKDGGIVVFDALERQQGFENTLQKYPEQPEHEGWASFDKSQIINAAKKNGLKLLQVEDYDEPEEVKVQYIDTILWGREPYNPYNLKVKLRWFVFKKTT